MQDRVLYDDVNECFWDRSLVLALLSPHGGPLSGVATPASDRRSTASEAGAASNATADAAGPPPVTTCYSHLRSLMMRAAALPSEERVVLVREEGVMLRRARRVPGAWVALGEYLHKTYHEVASWWHVLLTYQRVWIFGAVQVTLTLT